MEHRAGAQSVSSAIIILHVKKIFVDNNVIQQVIPQKGTVSLRSMKRREGVFSPKAQKWHVRKFHASQRNILH
jgi:transposase-like protein